jgi:hypothetical protein
MLNLVPRTFAPERTARTADPPVGKHRVPAGMPAALEGHLAALCEDGYCVLPGVILGLGRIVALFYRSSTVYQIY